MKRSIGIDISSSYVCAVQVARREGQFEIEKVFSAKTRRSTDSQPQILKSLVERHGFDKRADLAVSMPKEAVFFRNFETDATGPLKTASSVCADVEHSFPIRSEELVTQICSKRQLPHQRYSLLVAATAATSVRERLNTLATAKITPVLLEAPICAVYSTIAVNHPEIAKGSAIIAHVSESSLTLAVTQNSDILMVRRIATYAGRCQDRTEFVEFIVREAQLTWQRVFAAEITRDDAFYLVTESGAADALAEDVEENLICRLVDVDPYARMKDSARYTDYAPVQVAEGLALRLLAPEITKGVNFLDTAKVDAGPDLNLKKELLTCGILVGLIVLVSVGGLFTRLGLLEGRYGRLKGEMKQVFHAAVPEETNMVDPLAQLQQKLAAMRTNRALLSYISDSATGPLDVLKAVSESTPPEMSINIDTMLITTDELRLTGTAHSFDHVYDWQRRLQQNPSFASVEAQPVRNESGSGLVDFTVSVALVTGQE
jgi:Tfp pilus assembly protein PilN